MCAALGMIVGGRPGILCHPVPRTRKEKRACSRRPKSHGRSLVIALAKVPGGTIKE